jgi:drug/metabolite transporter (DMT)-like permease
LTAAVAATAVLELGSATRRGRLAVAAAAVAWSLAGVLQRELSVGLATQLAGRAFFAVLALFVYTGVYERGNPWRAFRTMGRPGLAVAALMAISSASFITALNHATVANVIFVQALAPILAALLGVAILKESVHRTTWIAMGIAIGGVALMVGGPGRPSLLGEALSLAMVLAFSLMLVVTRHQREVSMAPATCLSQLAVFVFAVPFAHPGEAGAKDVVLLVALGVAQIGLGLILLTVGARLIPAAEVALITLLEVVLAPLWVWIVVSERPSAATLVGGAIVLAAVLLQGKAAPA